MIIAGPVQAADQLDRGNENRVAVREPGVFYRSKVQFPQVYC